MAPLSDQERRILAEIERNLRAEDPRFATKVAAPPPPSDHLRRVRRGGLTLLLGLGLLIGFFVSSWVPIGVLAFAVMVAGLVLLTGGVHGWAGAAGSRRATTVASRRRAISERVERFERGLRDRYKRR